MNLEDEVVRGSIILHKGELMWPPPPPPKKDVAVQATPPPPVARPPPPPPNYFAETLKSAGVYAAGKKT